MKLSSAKVERIIVASECFVHRTTCLMAVKANMKISFFDIAS